ncbi:MULTISPECIES: ribonuclease activity regulator RraA [unclassified Roseitalea]|uniref:ribonuclease activity regulator RraA n=1 Tax=unclassified Roseitalea TaxID=2639107 RepID=UPI00273FE21A|nr:MULTISPECIES: ribonuclease activity regulator RraA [unclassified Roseitalea]
MTTLAARTLERLTTVSTATLTTALFKRGLRNVFLQEVARLSPGPNMVGFAYTLRTIPAREDVDVLDSFKDRSNPQRRAVEECPDGAVLVVDSRGDAQAASLGAILATRLALRGCAGIVTDGGYRDSPDIAAMAIPAYHKRPSAPTNLTRHHAVAINDPIACGGVAVFAGDVMVGDNEGVVCIPAHLAEEVAEEAAEMTVFEDFVQERVREGASTFGLYPPTDPQTMEDFARWRKERGR